MRPLRANGAKTFPSKSRLSRWVVAAGTWPQANGAPWEVDTSGLTSWTAFALASAVPRRGAWQRDSDRVLAAALSDRDRRADIVGDPAAMDASERR